MQIVTRKTIVSHFLDTDKICGYKLANINFEINSMIVSEFFPYYMTA